MKGLMLLNCPRLSQTFSEVFKHKHHEDMFVLLAHGMGSSVDTMLNVHWSSYWPLLEQTRMLHALARFVTLHHESRRLAQI